MAVLLPNKISRTTVVLDLVNVIAEVTTDWDFNLVEGRAQLGKRFELWQQKAIGGEGARGADREVYVQEEAIAYGQLEVCQRLWNEYTY